MINKLFYFAYGSNMYHKQMNKRCPSSKFLKPVYLDKYKFVYDGESKRWDNKAVANVLYSDGCQVWGGLFEINEDNLAALDCFEGHPNSYDKKMVEVQDADGDKYEAWVYHRTNKNPGDPSDKSVSGVRSCFLHFHITPSKKIGFCSNYQHNACRA